MNIFKRVYKALTEDERLRNSHILQALYANITSGLPSLAFQNINTLIKEGYQKNNDVFSVINWIGEQAANIPIVVEQFKNGAWEQVPTHPLQKLINKPNPYQSGLEQRMQFFGYYNVTGNGFLYGPRIESGRNEGQTLEMWVMPSQVTEIVSGGWFDPIKGYRVGYSRGSQHELRFEDVMHIKTPNLDFGNGSELWGMSPLRAGLLSLDRSNSNAKASATMFKTMGMAGIISEEGDPFSGVISDEQRKEAEDRIQDQYNGVFNAGKVMITNAKVNYIRLGLSAVDMNLIKDKQATLRDFCSIYKVSSILFNDNENSTYNNVLEAKKSAYNDAVIPLVNRFVQELNSWIVPSYGDDIRVVYDISDVAVLQADKKEQMEWISIGVDKGLLSRNRGLEILGLQTVDDPMMDVHTVNMGTMPLDQITFDPFIEDEEVSKMIGKHYLLK